MHYYTKLSHSTIAICLHLISLPYYLTLDSIALLHCVTFLHFQDELVQTHIALFYCNILLHYHIALSYCTQKCNLVQCSPESLEVLHRARTLWFLAIMRPLTPIEQPGAAGKWSILGGQLSSLFCPDNVWNLSRGHVCSNILTLKFILGWAA